MNGYISQLFLICVIIPSCFIIFTWNMLVYIYFLLCLFTVCLLFFFLIIQSFAFFLFLFFPLIPPFIPLQKVFSSECIAIICYNSILIIKHILELLATVLLSLFLLLFLFSYFHSLVQSVLSCTRPLHLSNE